MPKNDGRDPLARAKKSGGSADTAKNGTGLKGDAIAWLESLRFSALTAVIIGIVLVAVVVLTPNISVYVQQQREIRELRESVELHRQALTEAQAQKLKWQDPVYIRAQARERLYYVMPGEKQIAVIADGVTIPADDLSVVSQSLTKIQTNWSLEIARSVLHVGITTGAPDDFLNLGKR